MYIPESCKFSQIFIFIFRLFQNISIDHTPTMKLAIYGNSHAALLSQELAKVIAKGLQLETYCKRGAKVSSFQIPVDELSKLTEKDLLILLPFGNELLARKIQIERNPKFIRLLECSPTSQSKLNDLYRRVRQVLGPLKCRIILIDNIHRHVESKEAFLFFKKQNKIIGEMFSGIGNLTVVDHRKLLPIRGKLLKDRSSYSKILRDGVHLHPRFYRNMAEALAKAYNLA